MTSITTQLPASNGHQQSSTPDAPTEMLSPPRASWREHIRTRAYELQALSDAQRKAILERCGPDTYDAMQRHLSVAIRCADEPRLWTRLRSWPSGAAIERASTNLDAVEAHLLQGGTSQYVCGMLPSILSSAQRHLAPTDPRRQRLEDLARRTSDDNLDDCTRHQIVAAARAASSEGRREIIRVRSFRNVLLMAAAVLLVAAVALAALGLQRPTALPLCFVPVTDGTSGAPTTTVVCPSQQMTVPPGGDADEIIAASVRNSDIPLVLLVGGMAAAVSAAAALRNIRGTSTPYSLPVALAVLKLPTGALTAVLGLLLMRGQFIPGLSALDYPAQIVAWAVVLGYAQQLLTRFVDERAQTVLDAVGSPSDTPIR